jgi:hypothetical protein
MHRPPLILENEHVLYEYMYRLCTQKSLCINYVIFSNKLHCLNDIDLSLIIYFAFRTYALFS